MVRARSTVLVVEDDTETCALIQDLLASRGYRVETAPDGATALGYLLDGAIDILVLDQMLPLVHGLELCRFIREQPWDRYLPIIVITALTDERHRQNALAAGTDVYLTKPFDIDELLYIVDRWVTTCQRRKAERAEPIALMAEDRPAGPLKFWDHARKAVAGASRNWR
jgi:DNA-binding response OmpR family regulator